MRNLFIIHGSNGYPEENWFPWLKHELENKTDLRVIVPQFPCPPEEGGKHYYSEWLSKLKEFQKDIHPDTTFVTHSRGGVFIMHALVDLGIAQISNLFMVAPWIQYRWYDNPQESVDSFHYNPIDWAKLKQIVQHIEIFQSDNDMIPVEEGVGISAMLKAHLEMVSKAGHFNTSAGYQEFPLLRDHILLRIQKLS
ncbi:hypothetical protein COW38_02250 [Candidatus Collierbacteria bacterium CG17_big_fil_post_rev_8_21_14_2_50_45_7]|uniref:Serine hydrolase family protein n=1 Tax=Candidatus Collierbacteria bacterium CG17_big_fil_post_rev_8_21_14_2_50_45_7 TaxID=1974536 RepID=A0A2M7FQ75_9BACT|nr:MAG: hypothetical protein COW38_02250 [Candidatus Collierbacteria bacterium CG17_big_fil_post_rev_8_21_14_2_50_45_7]